MRALLHTVYRCCELCMGSPPRCTGGGASSTRERLGQALWRVSDVRGLRSGYWLRLMRACTDQGPDHRGQRQSEWRGWRRDQESRARPATELAHRGGVGRAPINGQAAGIESLQGISPTAPPELVDERPQINRSTLGRGLQRACHQLQTAATWSCGTAAMVLGRSQSVRTRAARRRDCAQPGRGARRRPASGAARPACPGRAVPGTGRGW